ncbi:MAG TPA: hypothetical protein VLI41_03845 [Phenylobacterium sp.]|uniref:AMP-binding enzyme n=1 Tax=Phenylobacterium sp. TaxID=1871053 RepID=UPI002CF5F8E3|nr:hypothetical protein [Phenylobacterium sp.]HSV02316.1 hypothetical protein [Phenylobacterium sp.]
MGGQKLQAADLEAALRAHDAVADAAVVGVPTGPAGDETLHAFVTLEPGLAPTDVLQADIKGWLRREVGAHAVPAEVRFVRGLPKARSGEVVRSILRKVAAGDVKDLGDLSALADPSVIDDLVAGRTPAEA